MGDLWSNHSCLPKSTERSNLSVVVASRRVKQGYCSAVILETGILQRLEHNSLHDLPLAREHAGGAGKYKEARVPRWAFGLSSA